MTNTSDSQELEPAVPLLATPDPGAVNIGTGFLARRRGVVGLVTAAHVPINRQPHAVNGWDGWPWRMRAVPPGGARAEEIALFSNTIPVRPTFTWMLGDSSTGRMADMIGLYSFHNEAAIQRLATHFRVYDLDTPPVVISGEAVTAIGFPVVHGRDDWPSYPARKHEALFVSRTTEILKLDQPATQGHSGGPVLNAGGDLVGMLIGEDAGLASVVSVEALSVL